MRGERLQTVLARAGHGSRRAADRWIVDGRVTVNGTVATPGTRVDPGDEVALDGRRLDLAPPRAVHLAIHKPRGVLSTTRSGYGHQTVVDLVTPPPPGRLWPAGRLDLDSEGLMLLTNDGAWAQRVLHPRFGVVRQYAVQLDREPDDVELGRLRQGIEIDGTLAQVLDIVRRPRPAGVGPSPEAGPWFAVHLGEGRNREVRRLFAAIGYRVQRLVRTAYGPITLAGLAPAAWRPLTDAEVTALEGGPPPTPAPASRPRRAALGLRIAVDGTSGSGKSTVGRALAQHIGARFVDTGLLYRAVTLAALEAGIDPADGPAVAQLTKQTRIRVRPADGGQPGERVTIGRREVTPLLREPRIERAVPTISQHAEVRAAMLTVQRDAARGQDTVMVGRDIGTVVLPDADLKVFLTASVETRARRRAAQMGRPDRVETYQREITQRDRTDSTRAVAPLRRAPGALVLDTGELDVDECVAAIVAALPPPRRS
ncbi:MAG TPA: (d)CMP kinase [Candidatus Limnocylindria bacterium]|nr:(d)CMP kinase [Candidatus Limnocylindria bacterium]